MPDSENRTGGERWPENRYPRLVDDPLGINTGEITLREVRAAVRKLKRRKTPGTDEVPIELLQELDDFNLL